MFQNYFKTAWRNIIRSKGYSTLNILGLSLGMAVALLIGLWVHYEYSYDKFLPNYEQLYQVRRNFNSNDEILTFSTTSLKLAETLRSQVPEIEYVVESDWMGEHGLMVGEKKLYMKGARIGSDFLKVFQYPLLYGNPSVVLSDPYSIVLTEAAAKTLFGNEDPVGKMVRFDNADDLKVTGILKDIPSNSTLQFKFLVPFSYMEAKAPHLKEWRTESFSYNGFQQFAKLKDGITYEQVAAKIKNIQHTEKDNTNAMKSEVIMQPLKDWHLYNEYKNGKANSGFIDYIKMFSIIGILVLLIACVNFINLITARSEKRAREVGVRKAIGSSRKDLILQFLSESFLLTFIAFVFSIAFVQLVLPFFNALIGKQIAIPFGSISFWLITFICIVLTSLIAGSRPAFYLSSFEPVRVLKSSLGIGSGASLPRKVLVVLQYSCSVALIISTIIIYQQIEHAKNRPAGFDKDRLMMTNLNSDLAKNYDALKNELLSAGIVESVTVSSSPATDLYWHSDVDHWPGKNAGETIEMATIVVGDDYFKTMGLGFNEGREFRGSSDTLNVIFNETAIKKMRLKDPLSQTVTWNEEQYRIIGVARDVLMVSPYAPAEPTMYIYTPGTTDVLLYRLSAGINTADAIAKLTAVFNKHNPAFPYIYRFTDDAYAAKFESEQLIGKLAALFAGLTIFISCLGLFGLAAYTSERRTKEIGIRKVLGASIFGIVRMLFRSFLGPVCIATIIAIPVASLVMNNWLQNYSYRINISPWVFVLAAVVAILIAAITVSFQSIKAALMNPVRSLKSE